MHDAASANKHANLDVAKEVLKIKIFWEITDCVRGIVKLFALAVWLQSSNHGKLPCQVAVDLGIVASSHSEV